MEYVRTGVILNTGNYEACVAFYRDVLGLRLLFARDEGGDSLSCFDFGGAYLMVETGGHARPGGKSIEESCAKLRLNVRDLDAARRHLRSRGVDAEISSFDWGRVIDIHDPDGNRVGIREEAGFADHIGS